MKKGSEWQPKCKYQIDKYYSLTQRADNCTALNKKHPLISLIE